MKCIKLNIKIFIILSIICIILLVVTIINSNNKNSDNNYNLQEIKIYEETCEEEKIDNFLLKKYQEKKLIALTFDDGPSKYTYKLLDILKDKNAKATFFLIGDNIKHHKEILKEIYQNDNEIGIHSYVHKLFTRITDEEIHEQIELTKSEILDIVDCPINLIRVPYGSLSDRVLNVIQNENLTSVLWDIDSLDWKLRNKDKVYNYVLKKIKGNQIILMHDTYKTSIEAVEKLINILNEKGYTFITVSEFIKLKKCYH